MGCASSKKKHSGQPVVAENSRRANKPPTLVKKSQVVGNYEILDVITKLPYGTIYNSIHISSKLKRCLKMITITSSAEVSMNPKHLQTEIKNLQSLDHPNILKIHDMFMFEQKLYVAMDPLQGSLLLDYLSKMDRISESTVAKIISQILSSVAYCHSRKVIHRDLNPKVIFISNNSNVKVSEFGSSAFMDPENKLVGKTYIKTFVAPEVFDGFYNEKCDIWSVGIIFHLLLTGDLPTVNKNSEGKDVATVNIEGLKQLNISSEAIDLIGRMMHVDFRLRPAANEALEHAWTVKYSKSNDPGNEIAQTLAALKKYKKVSEAQDSIREFIASQIVSYEESQDVIKAFQALDTNWDGKISKDEFMKHYMKVMTSEKAEMVVNEIFERSDRDRNGFIEFSEFVKAGMAEQSIMSYENIKKAFQLLDKDNSAKLDISELQYLLGESADKNLRSLLAEADANNDGEIDFKEFVELLKKKYKIS